MPNNIDADTLLIHYFFNDETHYMDAFVRNRCEKELLAMISTISTELNVQTKVEVGVKKEGGIVEIYNFLVSNDGVALAAYGALLLQFIQFFIPKKSKKDKLEQDLNIENLRLSIDKAKQEQKKRNIKASPITEEKITYLLNENIKLKKQKSNFYKKLLSVSKIEKIETSISTNNTTNSQCVLRKDFNEYILDIDELEPLLIERTKIEVISPVLKKGKYKWRGFYIGGNVNIEFSMNDTDFRNDVINDAIPFKTGTFIECDLVIERKIDEDGNVFNSNYKVTTVYSITEGDSIQETSKGKRIRKKKEANKMQLNLFDENSNKYK